jgi:hypothetical protein
MEQHQPAGREESRSHETKQTAHVMSRANIERWANCAAVYVRMSTEHQQYSTSNQMDVIREYAKRLGFTIVKEYSDQGKSGLNMEGRDALGQMLRDVQEGRAEYAVILVYDVSRWGRFQNPDESAFYEYACQQAGVFVHYCAEQFANDGSPVGKSREAGADRERKARGKINLAGVNNLRHHDLKPINTHIYKLRSNQWFESITYHHFLNLGKAPFPAVVSMVSQFF